MKYDVFISTVYNRISRLKYIILIAGCCAAAVVFLYCKSLPKIYSATATVFPLNATNDNAGAASALSSLLGLSETPKSFVQEASINIVVQLLAWFTLALVALNRFHIISFLDNEFICVLTVAIIIAQIEKKNRIINLDNLLFSFIGKISYGIYVIHAIVIFYLSKIISCSENTLLNFTFVYTSVLLATIFLAYLSYEYFEKRFLKMKERFSSIKTLD